MIQSRSVLVQAWEKDTIMCDICKKKYIYDNPDHLTEIQEFVCLNVICGYGSVFGDDNTIKIDICQHCLKEKLGEYIRISSTKE